MATQARQTPAKQRIAQVALDLFAARGFDNVGVTEIAEKAGVSQPSIHYHFRSKQDLWEASMGALVQDMERASSLRESVLASLDPLSSLKALCAIIIEQSVKTPNLGRVILSEGQTGGPRLDWLMRHVFAEGYYQFLELIEECVEAKLIKPYNPYQILMLLHGAAVTHFNVAPLVDAVFGEDPRSRENANFFQEMYMDVIFAGLALPKRKRGSK